MATAFDNRQRAIEYALDITHRDSNSPGNKIDKAFDLAKRMDAFVSGNWIETSNSEKSYFLKFVHAYHDTEYVEEKWMTRIIKNLFNKNLPQNIPREYSFPRQTGVTRFLILLHSWLVFSSCDSNIPSMLFVQNSRSKSDLIQFINTQLTLTTAMKDFINSLIMSIGGYSPRGHSYNYVLGDCLFYNKDYNKEDWINISKKSMVVVNTID